MEVCGGLLDDAAGGVVVEKDYLKGKEDNFNSNWHLIWYNTRFNSQRDPLGQHLHRWENRKVTKLEEKQCQNMKPIIKHNGATGGGEGQQFCQSWLVLMDFIFLMFWNL